MKKIGVQKGLTPVKDYLQSHGYTCKEVDTTQKTNHDAFKGCDAVVLTGLDENEMGISNTATKIPVINADGLTPEDVKTTLDRTI